MRNIMLTRTTWAVWWGGLALLVTVAAGQEPTEKPAAGQQTGDVVVQRDLDKQILRIQIPAKNGRVAWSDVLRALMRSGHLDDRTMQDKLPEGTLDLTRTYSQYTIMAVNLWLAPDIRMQIVPESREVRGHLLVTVDEGAILAKRRQLTKRVRDRLTEADAKQRAAKFGFRLPANWEQSDQQQPLVMVVHGFNSSPERFEPLASAFRESGLVAGTYSYPDDQPIAASAEQLSRDLKGIGSSQPQRRIALVTHSMGGLVARAVIEDPDLDAGNVSHLIMVAPPNQGSLLARFAFGMDILDHAIPDSERREVSRFYAVIEDGLSEATTDLQPDSTFLHQLNARGRNPKVRYTIFLGSGGHFTRPQVDELREGLATAKSESDVVGLFAPRIDETLADLDEVIRGLGDGVVAVKRGKLAGVEDTVVLEFTHLGAFQQTTALGADPLYKMVLQRLQK
jgi:pimeloyl-ACP methyl ester carboxylesterase